MEEVTCDRRIRSLRIQFITLLFLYFFSFSLQAQRPSERYKATVQSSRLEPRVRTFISACLHKSALPKPIQLYAQGAWFVTSDLPEHIRQQGNNDDGTAQVWQLNGRPRAVSLWVHDDEFDRSTLACLDDKDVVIRQINEYMPGTSEPDLHYIYVHTFTLGPSGKYHAAGSYTDWDRHAIRPPKLTSEDRDFIAGERQYQKWKDFDFAGALATIAPNDQVIAVPN